MSKRVHFAKTMTVYSEDESGSSSPSPSPLFSVSSLSPPNSSSPDLSTPPPDDEDEETPTVKYPVTPFSTEELQLDPFSPEMPPESMHIHFMLAFSPFDDPAMSWDISFPPPAPYHPSEDEQSIHLKQMLAEPATSPPLTLLAITHPHLKWKIEVVPKDPAPGAYVSVNDVLSTIFKELRIAIHPNDYAGLTDVDTRTAVDAAYYSRCKRIPDSRVRSVEQHKGIKRVDMLMGRTNFLGLSGTRFGPDSWELNTA